MSPPQYIDHLAEDRRGMPELAFALASLGRAIWGGYISGSMIRVDGRCIRGMV